MRRLILLLLVVHIATAADRSRFNLNSDWKVRAGDAPGAEAPALDDSHWNSASLAQLPGAAWYRKHFKLPASSSGQKIFLETHGVGGEFFLNGKSIGRHDAPGSLGFDITAAVKPAPLENILAARVSHPGGASAWLYITSRLHQTLPLHSTLGTTGVYIYAQDFDIAGQSAAITAEAQVRNEFEAARAFTFQVVVQDIEGRTIATLDGGPHTLRAGETSTVSASGTVGKLHFWSWGYGYLYVVSTVLKVNGQPVDTDVTRTGFRKTEFANGILKLNDRAIQLNGYVENPADGWPIAGLAAPAWLSDFSNRLVVDGNATLLRWAPGLPSRRDIDSCDREGLMQSLAAPELREAVIENRNNPSVLFYAGGADVQSVLEQFDPHGGRVVDSGELALSPMPASPMRVPSEQYFVNQVKWNGWADVQHPAVRILGHWTYPAGTRRDVQVVSNAERVELRLNNQSLGNGQHTDRFLFPFPDIEWQEGMLQAIAYDAGGRRAATARLDSTGPPAYISLNLRTGHNGLMADGADLALVDVEVMDGYGRRCPLATNRVHLSVAGPAELLGDADVSVEEGIRRIFLRAGNHAGRIVLQANSEGLQLGVIDLLSRPVAQTGGLSTEPEGDDLQPYLGKGPTPASTASRR